MVDGAAPNDFEFPPERSFARLIREAFRAFNKSMQSRLDRHDVTLGQWAFLRVLWEEDGKTQRELAKRLGLMEPTAMFSLNSLEKRGLITRLGDAADRRKVNIHLTAKGRALRRVLLPYAKELNELALRGLSTKRVGEMSRDLSSIIGNLRADVQACAPGNAAPRVRKRSVVGSRAER